MPLSVKSLIYIDGLVLIGMVFFRWALEPRMKRLIDIRVFALMLLLPALLLFSPKLEIAYAGLALAAMCARSRPELCAGYLLMLPMVPELSIDYSVGGLYITRMSSGAALGVGALIALIWTARVQKLPGAKYDVVAAALVILFTVTSAHGLSLASYGRSFIDYFLTIGVPYLLVSRCIGSEKDARIVLTRFYLAGALCAVIALFEATRHWALYDSIPGHLELPSRGVVVLNVRAGLLRSGGPFLNPTAFAFFLAVLPAGLWAIRSYFHKAGYWMVTALLLLGLLATQSRGAWIACAAGYCALLAYRGKRIQAAAAVAGGGLLYLIANILLPETGRLAESLGRAGSAAGTVEYRRSLLDAGIAQVKLHPWFGQSASDLGVAMSDLVQGQGIVDFVNAHLAIALSGGLLALAVWIGIWARPLLATWRRGAPVGRVPATQLQVIPETMLIVSMVALCFTSTAVNGAVWPTLALGWTGPMLAIGRRARLIAKPARIVAGATFRDPPSEVLRPDKIAGAA